MEKSEIITTNLTRLQQLSTPYNPVTGEGSILPHRVAVSIEGLREPHLYLPATWAGDRRVKELQKAGLAGVLRRRGAKGTPQMVQEEFDRERIRHDFEFWAATCTRITLKGEGREGPLILNRPQRLYLNKLEELRVAGRPIDIILCKARQWGGSTLTQLYMLWIQLVHKENWNSVICGDIEQQSHLISGMLGKVIGHYPLWATGGKVVKTLPYAGAGKTRVIDLTGSRYTLGSAQKPDSLRSEDISMAHCTEVGLWKATRGRRPEDLVQSIFGSIASGPYTMKILESTAKGVGNYFHRTWLDAVVGRNNFTPVFIPWYLIEMYSRPIKEKDYSDFVDSMNEQERSLFEMGATLEGIAWYRDKRREIADEWRMFSEFPSTAAEAFQSTGRRVFKIAYVQRARVTCVPPLFCGEVEGGGESGRGALGDLKFVPLLPGERRDDNCLWVWLMPQKEPACRDRYVVAVDVGGTSGTADYSCIVVADRGPMLDGGVPEVAACWHGHIEHDRLAWKAAQIAEAYGHALLVIESNTLETEGTEGDNFEYILSEIAGTYDNLYCRTSQQNIRQGMPVKWGFHTNPSTKPMVINFLIKALRDTLYIEHCLPTTCELDVFEIKENGRETGAVEGNHDDRVMATAILVWVCYNYRPPTLLHKAGGEGGRRTKIVSEASM